MRERGDIFRLLGECEASARSLLKSLNNPPEDWLAGLKAMRSLPYTWNEKVPYYYRAIRLVEEVRRNIERQNSPAAALAAFRLGQQVIILRDQKAYVDRERKSVGGKKRSLPRETVWKIQACYAVCYQRHPKLRNHPYSLAQKVTDKLGYDRKTVLKYVKELRKKHGIN